MRRAVLAVLLLAACEQPYSNADVVFVKSLPDGDRVRIALPDPEEPSGDGRITASYYKLAQTVTATVNQAVFGVLATVDRISRTPPASRTHELLKWGPFDEGGISHALEIVRTSTRGVRVPTSSVSIVPIEARYDFALDAWPAANPDLEVRVAGGTFAPLEPGGGGIGTLYVYLESLRAITGQPGRGYYWAAYDSRGGRLDLLLAYYRPEELGGNLIDVDSYYQNHRDADGAGTLYFYTRDGPTDELVLYTRWNSDRRGRADAAYADADLRAPIYAAECWDQSLLRTYFRATVPELGPPTGELEDCAADLRTPLYAP